MASHEPMRAPTNKPFVQTVLGMLQERDLPCTLWPTTGGGGPWSLMAAYFGMPVLFDVGLGYGGKAGAVGEFLVLDGADKVAGNLECEAFYAEMLERWAAAPSDRAPVGNED